MKKFLKYTGRVLAALVGLVVIFLMFTSIFYRVKLHSVMNRLRESGYENLVSVGDYNMNVLKVGKQNGDHKIVCCSGLNDGTMNFSWREMTEDLEKDNELIFLDRAGYGFSDDTKSARTIEAIVEDYRKALKNAGEEGPYILMGHSIGGMYISYWQNKYPEEIKGVIIVDGTLCTTVDENGRDEIVSQWKTLQLMEFFGFEPTAMKSSFGNFLDGKSKEYIDETLYMFSKTTGAKATISEGNLIKRNADELWATLKPNDIPKIFIDASYHFEKEPDAKTQSWDPFEKRMGNCKLVNIESNHTVYLDKPDEAGNLIEDFISEISNN